MYINLEHSWECVNQATDIRSGWLDGWSGRLEGLNSVAKKIPACSKHSMVASGMNWDEKEYFLNNFCSSF